MILAKYEIRIGHLGLLIALVLKKTPFLGASNVQRVLATSRVTGDTGPERSVVAATFLEDTRHQKVSLKNRSHVKGWLVDTHQIPKACGDPIDRNRANLRLIHKNCSVHPECAHHVNPVSINCALESPCLLRAKDATLGKGGMKEGRGRGKRKRKRKGKKSNTNRQN